MSIFVQLLLVAVWLSIALVIRHEMREQGRDHGKQQIDLLARRDRARWQR